MIADFQQTLVLLHEVNRKQELKDLLLQLLQANQMGYAESVARIALDLDYVIDQL
jgi:hypothetical protein